MSTDDVERLWIQLPSPGELAAADWYVDHPVDPALFREWLDDTDRSSRSDLCRRIMSGEPDEFVHEDAHFVEFFGIETEIEDRDIPVFRVALDDVDWVRWLNYQRIRADGLRAQGPVFLVDRTFYIAAADYALMQVCLNDWEEVVP